MGNGIFYIGCQFTKGAAIFRNAKNRVIAKAAAAMLFTQDGTPALSPDCQLPAIREDTGCHTDKLGATLSGVVNNLFDYQYIGKAYNTNSGTTTADNVFVFYNFGRTFTIRLKLDF